jgi:protein-disulfide isomerase
VSTEKIASLKSLLSLWNVIIKLFTFHRSPAKLTAVNLTILTRGNFRNPSRFMIRKISFCLLGVALAHNWGCRPGNPSEKVAEVDGIVVTRVDLDRSGGKALSALREQLHKYERQKLDEFIGQVLLGREAKSKGVSVSTLLDQEVAGKVAPIGEDEIAAFYASNKARLRVELEKVHDQIREYLREQKFEARKGEYLKSLRAGTKIVSYLKAPAMFRADVSVVGSPVRGAEKAAVTIVKFEDFQCPFCKTVQPTFYDLLKRYDGKVRIVHKDLPLDAIHPQARQAAEAARCAGDQGKFWDYHDKLYASSPKLGVEEIKAVAKEVGLDVGRFDQCLSSGKLRAAVQKDYADAAQLGLSGTPAFFINGREISGAQPLEAFAAIIDEELGPSK